MSEAPQQRPSVLIGGLLFTFPLSLLEGLVLRDYWNWFVRYAIEAAPRLSYWQGVALSIGVGILILDATFAATTARDPQRRWGFGDLFAKPVFLLFVWGVGAIWHAFLLPGVTS